MDIEQVIRAIFKADTSQAAAQVATLDKAMSGLEDRAASTNAAIAKPAAQAPVAGMTWKQFTAERMSDYMRMEGSHGAAMTRMSEEWAAYKASGEAALAGLADELPAGLRTAERGMTAVGRSGARASVGVGSLYSGMSRLVNIIPGLGMGGLVGGLIAAFEALFDLVDGDHMDRFARDTIRAAESVHGLARELGDAANKAGALMRNPDDMARKNLELRLENAKALEREAKQAGSKDQQSAAHDEVMRLERATRQHDAGVELSKNEQRLQALQTSDYELRRKMLNAQGEVQDLGERLNALNAMKVEGAAHGGLTPVQEKTLHDVALAFTDAQANAAAASFALSQLPQQLSQADEAVRLAREGLSFADTFNPEDIKTRDVNVNVANARINVTQHIEKTDPGELAGAALISSFRSLTNRVIRPEGMTAPTGRAR